MDVWKTNAQNIQRNLINLLGDRIWDEVPKEHLIKKVAIAISGIPTTDSTHHLGYLQQQHETASRIANIILSCCQPNQHIYFGCIYVAFKIKDSGQEGLYPVFRIPKNNDINSNIIQFIEWHTERVYEGWCDYLKCNKLPPCNMCYPNNGIYFTDGSNNQVSLGFAESPGNSNITDAAINICKVVASISLIFPPLRQIATTTLVTMNGISISRSANELHDISSHNGNINMNNPEALVHWLNIMSSTINTLYIAGESASDTFSSKTSLCILNVLKHVSITCDFFGIAIHIGLIVLKYRNNSLDRYDILRFTHICFFAANIIMNETVAANLISNIARFPSCNLLNVIRSKQFCTVKKVISLTECEIMNDLISLTDYSVNILRDTFDAIHQARKLYHQTFVTRKMDMHTFICNISMLVCNIYKQMQFSIRAAMLIITKVFKTHWRQYSVGNQVIFRSSTPSTLIPLYTSLKQITDNFDSVCVRQYVERLTMDAVNHFANSLNCQTDTDYVSILKYVCDIIKCRLNERIAQDNENIYDVLDNIISAIKVETTLIEGYIRLLYHNESIAELLLSINNIALYRLNTSPDERITAEFCLTRASELLNREIIISVNGHVLTYENTTVVLSTHSMVTTIVVFHHPRTSDDSGIIMVSEIRPRV